MTLCNKLKDEGLIQRYINSPDFKKDKQNQSLFKKTSDYWTRNRYEISEETETAVQK